MPKTYGREESLNKRVRDSLQGYQSDFIKIEGGKFRFFVDIIGMFEENSKDFIFFLLRLEFKVLSYESHFEYVDDKFLIKDGEYINRKLEEFATNKAKEFNMPKPKLLPLSRKVLTHNA